jgi:hypothetical protein
MVTVMRGSPGRRLALVAMLVPVAVQLAGCGGAAALHSSAHATGGVEATITAANGITAVIWRSPRGVVLVNSSSGVVIRIAGTTAVSAEKDRSGAEIRHYQHASQAWSVAHDRLGVTHRQISAALRHGHPAAQPGWVELVHQPLSGEISIEWSYGTDVAAMHHAFGAPLLWGRRRLNGWRLAIAARFSDRLHDSTLTEYSGITSYIVYSSNPSQIGNGDCEISLQSGRRGDGYFATRNLHVYHPHHPDYTAHGLRASYVPGTGAIINGPGRSVSEIVLTCDITKRHVGAIFTHLTLMSGSSP